MKLRYLIGVVGLTLLVVATMSQVGQSQTEEKTNNDELKKVLIQLSEARLKQAETELNISLDDNKRVPGVVAEVTIARMQLAVANAQARLKMTQGKPEEFSIALLKPSAELAVKLLEARTAKLEDAAARTGDNIAIVGAKRSRALLDVAKAELQSLIALEGQPLEVQVQWQLNNLSAAIDSLGSRVAVLEDKR